MDTCETCKHWGKPVEDQTWDDNPSYPNMRECDRIPFGPDLLGELRREQAAGRGVEPHDIEDPSLPGDQLACTIWMGPDTWVRSTRALPSVAYFTKRNEWNASCAL